MTTLLQRPVRRVEAAEPEPIRPPALSAALATGVAAGLGLVVCTGVSVVAWFTGSSGSFGDAMRAGGLAWLVANGGGLHTTAATITAIPLGGLGIAAVLMYRAGRWAAAASRTAADVGIVALTSGACYALVGCLVWAMTRSESASADLWRVSGFGVAVGGVLAGAGALSRGDARVALLERVPPDVRAALRGGASGVALMLVAGGVAFTASMAAHFSSAEALAEALHAGVVGGLVIALIGIVLVPNAALCAGAFVVGSGFALGTGTTVSPGDVRLGSLPIFPLLAAVPRHELPQPLVLAMFAVPMVAGGLAGVVSQRMLRSTAIDYAALRGSAAGLVTGVGFGALTWLATGGIGPARMARLGPDVAATTFVCAAGAALGGALVAVVAWLLTRGDDSDEKTSEASFERARGRGDAGRWRLLRRARRSGRRGTGQPGTRDVGNEQLANGELGNGELGNGELGNGELGNTRDRVEPERSSTVHSDGAGSGSSEERPTSSVARDRPPKDQPPKDRPAEDRPPDNQPVNHQSANHQSRAD